MRKVALRGLLAHKFRLLLTLTAVVVSVGFMTATQVLTATVSASFDDVFDDINKLIDVVARSADKVETNFGSIRAPLDGSVATTLQRVPGVVAAEGQVQGVASIIGPDGEPTSNPQAGPPTFGMNWPTEPALNGWTVTAGRPPAGPTEVFIDRRSVEKAGFALGEPVKIQSNKGAELYTLVGYGGFGSTPDYAGAPAALFDTATAQAQFIEPGKFDWINVSGDGSLSETELRSRVEQALVGTTPRMEAVTAEAFTEESASVFRRFLSIINWVLIVFGLVALSVGTFIIYNTFSIIVAQRTRELALLRAMGASRRQVLGSVTFEALTVGALASVTGLVFGVVLARGLTGLLGAFNDSFQIGGLAFPPIAFISSFLIGTVITVLSALFPALRASRVPPVAAMRTVAVDTSGHSRSRLIAGALIAAAGAGALYWGLFVRGDLAVVKTGAGVALVFLAAIVLGPLFAQPLSATIGAPLRGFNGRLARSNAMRNPRRTAATASALMIGVGLIVMFSILASSLKSSVREGVTSSVSANLFIDSQSFLGSGLDDALVDEVRQQPGVTNVVGIQAAFAELQGRAIGIGGADLAALKKAVSISDVDGDLTTIGPDEVAVARPSAESRNLHRGDEIQMNVLQSGPRTFRVGAIFEIEGLRGQGFLMSPAGFRASFPPQFHVYSNVYINVDPALAPDAVARLEDDISALVDVRYPAAAVQNFDELAADQTRQFDVMLAIVNVLLALAVLIAGLGIINTLLLSVYERTQEIGLLRAVGMARTQVRAVVRWESVIFGLQGTVMGIGIGFLFAWAMLQAFAQQASVISLTIPWGQLIVLPVLAAIAAVVAAVIPAFTASNLAVLDAISADT